uniref:Semaphorin n=1 Tax=Hirudo medicinalis TaxID=6421 RepID=J7EGE5_HIRME|nr:semaphorin precursor [Hirudo medicinalis]
MSALTKAKVGCWLLLLKLLLLLLLLMLLGSSHGTFHGGSMNELAGFRALKVAGQVFNGNKSHMDHFSAIHLEKNYMLVGARNFIFNVSLHNLNEHRRISWSSNDVDTDLCLRRQKTQVDCQNYIRVIVRTGDDEFYACGTNSYKPMCRLYKVIPPKKHAILIDEESGTAKAPFDRRQNSTAAYHNGRLYSATVADVTGRDALIFSKPLRTEHHDSKWLNDPSFVSSFSYGDRIYFFFRETAVENINCGKVVFSRVARVCANDSGGQRVLRNTWTSFSKVRLNCSLPGEFPFYFDEIQSTSELGSGSLRSTIMTSEQTPMIYALFTTPRNSIRGSAVCAFRMSDIVSSFEGPYKEQRSPFHIWLPLRDAPVPHPGSFCPNSSRELPDQTLNFIKSHPLMDRAVPTFGGEPAFIHTGFDFTLTSISVDWQLEAANHRFYDVIFLGTDNGRVIKIYNKGRGLSTQTVVSEVLQVFSESSPVLQLKIFNSPARRHRERKLLVVSEGEIKSIFLHRCSAALTCSACVDLKDPYCAWKDNKCSHSSHGLQNLETGHHPGCEGPSPSQEPPTATPTTAARDVATFHDGGL